MQEPTASPAVLAVLAVLVVLWHLGACGMQRPSWHMLG